MMRLLLMTAFMLIISNRFYGQEIKQNKGKVLAIDGVSKKTFSNGDVLSIKVRNLTPNIRGFTIEAVALSKEPYYYNAIYSAYFNNDTLFFKKLRTAKKLSREEKIQYVLPNYVTNTYAIKGNTDTTISFIIKGMPIQKGVLLKLKITSDIVGDDYEIIYSDPFHIFSLPG